jgi:hypothetical protein
MMPTTHSVDDEWESKCTEQQKDSKNHRRQLMPRHDLDLPLQQLTKQSIRAKRKWWKHAKLTRTKSAKKQQKAALLSSEEWERIAVRNNLDGKQNMHTVPKRVDPLENQGRTKM